jgi:hypothetical protein
MVLGTLPIVSGTTIGEHYSFLKCGHDSIINDWRTEFGRHLTLVDDSEANDADIDSIVESRN